MLRSLVLLFAVFSLSFLSSCTTDALNLDEVQFKKKPPKTALPCETAFLSQNNPPGSLITIVNVSTGVVVSSFTVNANGTATDYVTLETNQTYQWTSSISLPGQVLYCSCGDNFGTLSHGAATSKFTTSGDNSPYTTCSF